MTKAGEREIVKAEHANGGAGYILKEALLTEGILENIAGCSAR